MGLSSDTMILDVIAVMGAHTTCFITIIWSTPKKEQRESVYIIDDFFSHTELNKIEVSSTVAIDSFSTGSGFVKTLRLRTYLWLRVMCVREFESEHKLIVSKPNRCRLELSVPFGQIQYPRHSVLHSRSHY